MTQRFGSVSLVDTELIELVKSNAFVYPADRYQLGSLIEYVQPASIDLPISGSIFLVKEKVLPFSRRVADLLPDLVLEERSLKGDGAVLLRGQTYLIHFGQIALPAGHRGCLSPKSSIGRIDLMVRGIVDDNGLYDTVPGGRQSRDLWFEVSPQSFNVRLQEGLALTQLMVFRENRSVPPIDISTAGNLVFDNVGNPITPTLYNGTLVLSLRVPDVEPHAVLSAPSTPSRAGGGEDVVATQRDCGTSGGVGDLPVAAKTDQLAPRDEHGLVGYEAVATNEVIDLSKIGAHPAANFFRPVTTSMKGGRLTLEKDRFYILATKEFISVPLNLSAEMVPFSHLVGELRAHYAGFFDPGFGYGKQGETRGTIGVLEVRPHETITIYDGQPICMMEFYPNGNIPAKPYGYSGNNYAGQQGPKLAKYFKM
eukprot:m.397165 g.397165  ORF g.397165 m.397165 type:complete len:424 (+) comp21125_c0_seq3:240-1511(+)